GGADVDVGDPAIAASCREELFGFPEVEGHDRGGESLWYSVLDGDGFVYCFVLEEVEDRGECFMADDPVMRFGLCDTGLDITAAVIALAVEYIAFHEEAAAF